MGKLNKSMCLLSDGNDRLDLGMFLRNILYSFNKTACKRYDNVSGHKTNVNKGQVNSTKRDMNNNVDEKKKLIRTSSRFISDALEES